MTKKTNKADVEVKDANGRASEDLAAQEREQADKAADALVEVKTDTNEVVAPTLDDLTVTGQPVVAPEVKSTLASVDDVKKTEDGKKVVEYTVVTDCEIKEGESAFIHPLGPNDTFELRTLPAIYTSQVTKVNSDGFETAEAKYVEVEVK